MKCIMYFKVTAIIIISLLSPNDICTGIVRLLKKIQRV